MTKLDKILTIIFYIYIIITLLYFLFKYVTIDNKVVSEIQVRENIEENYVLYENKTVKNINVIEQSFYSMLLWIKNQFIDYNNKLVASDRLKSDYFDFYRKYDINIEFINYVQSFWTILNENEKRYFLWNIWKTDKIIWAIEKDKIISFNINNTILWDGKKLVIDKDKSILRIQNFDIKENNWRNIYFWNIEIPNIHNKLIYNIKFINKTETSVYWIIYSFDKNLNIWYDVINIDYKDKIIEKVRYIQYDKIYDDYLNNSCNKLYKYIYVNNEKISLLCRNWSNWLMEEKIIFTNKK